jgi:hypothetical protein
MLPVKVTVVRPKNAESGPNVGFLFMEGFAVDVGCPGREPDFCGFLEEHVCDVQFCRFRLQRRALLAS